MKVKELITTLQSLPDEAKERDILLQFESPDDSYMGWLTRVYYVLQNQYMAKDNFSHRITQDEYDALPDTEPNNWHLVKKDFEPWLPAYSVFALSEVTPEERKEPKTKAQLIKETIAEGNIPHLSIVRE